jgi:hypothetical protein
MAFDEPAAAVTIRCLKIKRAGFATEAAMATEDILFLSLDDLGVPLACPVKAGY